MKILIIDDDIALGTEVVAILERNGYEARHVNCAREAIPMAESGDFERILVDYRMPEHDGLWFMKTVRLPHGTKALLVTSHTDKQKIKGMFSAGVCGYVIKPFDEDELLWHLNFHASKELSYADITQASA